MLQSGPNDPAMLLGEGEQYASEDSIYTSVAFLQETLSGMGLGDDLNLLSAEPADVASTCNALYALLLQHHKDTQYKEQLRQEMSRTRLELKAMDKERGKLEGVLNIKEREIKVLASKALAGEDGRKKDSRRAKREAEDLQKRLLGSERRLVQMQHEIKRKEKEYERVQERLSHYLADKKKNETAALDMAGQVLQAATGNNSNVAASKALRSDEGLKAVVAAYEGKQAELAKENKDLKAALASLQGEYKTALNSSMAMRELDMTAVPVVEDSFLQLVPNMSVDELRTELAAKLKVLQRRLANLTWRGPSDAKDYRTLAEQRMSQDLTIATSVIRDQEQLITSVLSALRGAQMAQEAQHQADVRALTQRYQEQLAAAETQLSRIQTEAGESLTALQALEELKKQHEELAGEHEALLMRAQSAERSAQELEAGQVRAVKGAARAGDVKAAAALAAAKAAAQGEMARVTAEQTELEHSMKRAQSSLRAETAALRERLVAEKAAAARAIAERDELASILEAKLTEAERVGAARTKVDMHSLMAEKEATLLDLQVAVANAERRTEDVKAELEQEKAAIEQELNAKVKTAYEALSAAERRADTMRAELEEDAAGKLAIAVEERKSAMLSAEALHSQTLAEVEARHAAVLQAALEERRKLEQQMEEAERRFEEELSALEAELATMEEQLERAVAAASEREERALLAANEREISLKYNLEQAHREELATLQSTIANERESLLAQAEANFDHERHALAEREAQLQAQLDSEHSALQSREESLRVQAAQATAAIEAGHKFEELTHHYKKLMVKYAPGLGAGLFIEQGVDKRATEMVGGKPNIATKGLRG